MEVSLRRDMRWIPVGMTVRYQSLAKTQLRGVCQFDSIEWLEPQDVLTPVRVTDTNDVEVFTADITMRLSWKKKRD